MKGTECSFYWRAKQVNQLGGENPLWKYN